MTARTRSFTSVSPTENLRPMGLLARLVKLNAIWSERRKLARLDENILNDIGRSRTEANSESQREAWDAPARWMR